jgi:glycosyltransferase involved in cell wall biosynthesis
MRCWKDCLDENSWEMFLEMNKHPRMKIIFMMRSIGPTSMPWGDLYNTARRLAPGILYPPIKVSPFKLGISSQWENCGGIKRRYFAAGPLSAILQVRKIYKRLRARGQDLAIHVHSPVLGFLACILSVICPRMKIVVSLHNNWPNFRWHQRVGLFVISLICDRLITVSDAITQTMPETVSKKLNKKRALYAIPNGIKSEHLAKIQWKHSRLDTAVVVARMVPQKNCFFILELIDRIPSINKLLWYGTGHEREQIEKEIKRLGIEDKVALLGVRPREEVFRALAGSSIYIAASKWEGIGVANLEAAALGCRPFLSDIPPHKEITDALGITTLPLDHMNSWIGAIEDFMKRSPAEKEKERREIAEAVQREFDLDLAVSRYIEIYRGIPMEEKGMEFIKSTIEGDVVRSD